MYVSEAGAFNKDNRWEKYLAKPPETNEQTSIRKSLRVEIFF
jgi:hypothetical protein